MSIERLKELIHELDCIKYSSVGFPLASGGVSYYKIVCDPLFENSEAREVISRIGYQLLQKIETETDIVGVVTGGYEFAKLVAEKAGRTAIGVNPHNGEVIGTPRRENRCYFDDVVTKGLSILKSHNILGDNKKDNYAITMIDRLENGEQNLAKNRIILKAILTKNDLEIKH